MENSKESNYRRVEETVIWFNNSEKYSLDTKQIDQTFLDWIGISAHDFLPYTSSKYAQQLLNNQQVSLFEKSNSEFESHIEIIAMTDDEYQAENLITYSFSSGLFGDFIMARTEKGICYLAFENDKSVALTGLKNSFPNALFREQEGSVDLPSENIFQHDGSPLNKIKLHLKGTDFQLKVWRALLEIPFGKLSTYGKIAAELNNPKASRAVGTAIGSNPVAFLIPCHRVVQSTGKFEGYRWGTARKKLIIGWEQVQTHKGL